MGATRSIEDRLGEIGDHYQPPSQLWERIEACLEDGEPLELPAELDQSGRLGQHRRLASRRVAGGVALAATLVAGGIVAAAALGPGLDPERAARFDDGHASERRVHLEGWRPELNAERVRCTFADGRPDADTLASEFPLAERMTVQHLIDECTSGNDSARTFGYVDAATAMLCSQTDALRVPVIATGFPSCVDAGFDAVADPDAFMEELHQRRAFELTMKTPDVSCMTHTEAINWLEHGRAAAPVELHQTDQFDNPSGPCWNVWLMWEQGLIFIQPGDALGS